MSEHYIVGVGASAGGLEAIEDFFDNMPSNTGFSFVVVQHLSPDYESLMGELLAKRVKMKVQRIEEKENGVEILPNCIYLIPPKRNIVMDNKRLFLIEQDRSHSFQLPIDVFFKSLAADQKDKAIAVILSGTGSDGAKGAQAIKIQKGMVVAQDPQTAKFDGMPRSTIATGLVDHVLPANEIPDALINHIKEDVMVPDRAEKMIEDKANFNRAISLIRKHTGLDFSEYKPGTVARRMNRRMVVNQIKTFEEYVDYLRHNPKEVETLQQELFINVTRFFRDKKAFEVLDDRVISSIMENSRLTENAPIRVWVCACSTGEEAYSIAILFLEHIRKYDDMPDPQNIKIFATDADYDAIETASQGKYVKSCLADLSPALINRYFDKVDEMYQVKRKLRDMVIFAKHNIISDPPFTKMDLISCRNLLIYFQPKLQQKVLSLLRFSLNSEGCLFLGTSETVGALTTSFLPIDEKWRIYKGRISDKSYLMDGLKAMSMMSIPVNNYRLQKKQTNKGKYLQGQIQKYLLDNSLPATIIVNDTSHMIYTFGDVSSIINFQSGKATLNLLDLVHPDLAIALGTALKKSIKNEETVIFKGVELSIDYETYLADVKSSPMYFDKLEENLFMIQISLQKYSLVTNEEREKKEKSANEHFYERIKYLEEELIRTRENLQIVIEEQETTNEELQSTNEELVASNEELQSTNEELQSVNEELYTVNNEYQMKIEELTEVNNDISNLLSNNQIGTLFLDTNLCIRKFTPDITRFINVIDTDIGRRFSDLSQDLVNREELLLNAQAVLAGEKKIEKEFLSEDEQFTRMTLRPYLTDLNLIKGVVITFTTIRKSKAELT